MNDRGEVIGVVSWREADAKNVSFAIPSGAVARMNATLPLKNWTDAVRTASSATHPPGPGPVVRAKKPADVKDPGDESYGDFLDFLSARAGQRLIVIVKDRRGAAKQFSFQVPKHPAE